MKAGDKVRCVDDSYCSRLLVNDEYVIESVSGPYWVIVDGVAYSTKRFELIKEDTMINQPLIGGEYKAFHSTEEQWYDVIVLHQHPNNKEAFACMRKNGNTLFWSGDFKELKSEAQIQLDKVMSHNIQQLTFPIEQAGVGFLS